MKWFKHYSDMHRGRSLNTLLDALGHTGLCFFILQEMCADKFDGSGTDFQFHTRIVRQTLRISPTNLRRLLDICAANGLLSFEFSGSSLQISMPILLELQARDELNARKRRAKDAKKTCLDLDLDLDLDKDKDKELNTVGNKEKTRPKPSRPKPEQQAAVAVAPEVPNVIPHYCDEWKTRYGASPPIDRKTAGQLTRLVKEFGYDRSVKIISSYLAMNDSWFVKKRHDVGTMVTSLNAIAQFAATGKGVNNTQLRQSEVHDANMALLEKVRKGEL
jgi:hypothetical protein